MVKILYIMIGGAIGTALRYCVSGVLFNQSTGFGWGTLCVNMVGAFIIGFFMETAHFLPISHSVKSVLTAGLLGGFTTYSAFAWECVDFFRLGLIIQGLGYLCVTNIGGIILVLLGVLVARLMFA